MILICPGVMKKNRMREPLALNFQQEPVNKTTADERVCFLTASSVKSRHL